MIIVTGNTTIDHVYHGSFPLHAGVKVQTESRTAYPGGQAANVAATLGGLGFPVAFIGAFSGGTDGNVCRDDLQRRGVDIALSRCVSGTSHHTATIYVESETGTRTILMHKPSALCLDDVELPNGWTIKCEIFYTDGHEVDLSIRLGKQARRAGIPVVMDCERCYDGIEELVAQASSVIAPAEVLLELTSASNVEQAAARVFEMGPQITVATRGENGAVGVTRSGEVTFVPALPVDTADTTGAGDAFHAGYIAAALVGFDLSSTMAFATEVAARKCEVHGPRLPKHMCIELRERLNSWAGHFASEGVHIL